MANVITVSLDFEILARCLITFIIYRQNCNYFKTHNTKYTLLFLIAILFDPKLEQPKKHDNNEPLSLITNSSFER